MATPSGAGSGVASASSSSGHSSRLNSISSLSGSDSGIGAEVFVDPIKLLNQRAADVPRPRNFAQMVHVLHSLMSQANVYMSENRLEQAYVLFMRYTIIVLELSRSFPEAKASPENKQKAMKYFAARHEEEQKNYIVQKQAEALARAKQEADDAKLAREVLSQDAQLFREEQRRDRDSRMGTRREPSEARRSTNTRSIPDFSVVVGNRPVPLPPADPAISGTYQPSITSSSAPLFQDPSQQSQPLSRSTSMYALNRPPPPIPTTGPSLSTSQSQLLLPTPSIDRSAKPFLGGQASDDPDGGSRRSSRAPSPRMSPSPSVHSLTELTVPIPLQPAANSAGTAPPPVPRSAKPTLSGQFEMFNETRLVSVPHDTMSTFLALAQSNTDRNLETCGILAGHLKNSVLSITHLIVPKQSGTADSCTTSNEEELIDFQVAEDLITIGWIHSCFMSSIDLHTHCSYQLMLKESIASRLLSNAAFVLTQPHGLEYLQGCDKKGFHPHMEHPPLYEQGGHVTFDSQRGVKIVDLRKL
ncbi:STAM binding protein [Capsaspora owczarzaki ATCC 30864]|uniref:STAM binding protein n=1 Tax=Capsaspora owczarzaki (strain ATCC 30864) TaxID=595528 RepID=UPI0003525FC1|nr:STAM binding protein [Capsaspora owczarzaki ATCC 30864]|eukprot:XP_004348068.2 STAM binding protein [Capsaspora owczarzaki ATCC 30864]